MHASTDQRSPIQHPEQTVETAESLERLHGAYIADILRVWNGQANEWVSQAPIIVRLEQCDIVAFGLHDGSSPFMLGSIDTDAAPEQLYDPGYEAGSSGKPADTIWKSYRPLSHMIGKQVGEIRFGKPQEPGSLVLELASDRKACLCIRCLSDTVVAEKAGKRLRGVGTAARFAPSPAVQHTPSRGSGSPNDASEEAQQPGWSLPVRFHDPSEVVPVLAS